MSYLIPQSVDSHYNDRWCIKSSSYRKVILVVPNFRTSFRYNKQVSLVPRSSLKRKSTEFSHCASMVSTRYLAASCWIQSSVSLQLTPEDLGRVSSPFRCPISYWVTDRHVNYLNSSQPVSANNTRHTINSSQSTSRLLISDVTRRIRVRVSPTFPHFLWAFLSRQCTLSAFKTGFLKLPRSRLSYSVGNRIQFVSVVGPRLVKTLLGLPSVSVKGRRDIISSFLRRLMSIFWKHSCMCATIWAIECPIPSIFTWLL